MPENNNNRHNYHAGVMTVLLTLLITVPSSVGAFDFSGKVSDTLHNPIANATIRLFEPESGTEMYSSGSDAAGNFSFSAVVEAYYQVFVSAPTYPDQWVSSNKNTVYRQYRTYIGAASTFDTLYITLVSNHVDNTPNNTLTITLADSTGTTLLDYSDIYVTLLRNFDGYQFPGKYPSDKASVTFDSLQVSEYAILISLPNMVLQYYHPDRNTTWPLYYLPVSGGSSVTQTVRCYDPPRGDAVLNGICRSESNELLSGLTVSLCQPYDTFEVLYTQTTNESGVFSFSDIVNIDYLLKLSGGNYPVQWFSKTRGATTRYPDDYLWLGASLDTLDIKVSMEPINNPIIGSIQLWITDSSGALPTGTGNVYLVADTSVIAVGFDSASGYYYTDSVPAGSYSIKLDFAEYPVQYYTPSGNSTTPAYYLSIVSGTSLSYNIGLLSNPQNITTDNYYGYLSGMVYDSTGPLGNATVTVYSFNSGMVLASTSSDMDGTFGSIALPSQLIYILIEQGDYPPLYWSSQGMTTYLSNVNAIYVNAFDSLTVDALLTPEGTSVTQSGNGTATIQGKVTVQTTGLPAKGVRIVLLDYDPGDNFNAHHLWSQWSTLTDSAGSYTITAIPFGNYRCMAEADSLNYVVQFYPKTDVYTAAKTIVIDSSVTSLSLDFSLRNGAIMQGSVTDETGSTLPDARIYCSNSDNTRTFESISSSDGTWTISGIPGGTWNVWVNHDQYCLINDTINRSYTVTEGASKQVPAFMLTKGGFVSGSFTAAFSLYDTSLGYDLTNGELFCFPYPPHEQGSQVWPEHSTGIFLETLASDGTSGTFYSYVIKPGTFTLLFLPIARSRYPSAVLTNTSITPGLGYSFLSSTSSSQETVVTISSGDTVSEHSLTLRKGYSIFVEMKNESGLSLSNNCGIDAFIKIDTVYYLIAHSNRLPDGRFELPGLIDNEDYYLSLWADGYPGQFWSPDGNTVTPSLPYHFTATDYSPLQLGIIPWPEGAEPGSTPSPVPLWIDGDSLGMPLLSWANTSGLPIETYTIYRCDRMGTLTTVATVPASSTNGTYTYRHQDSYDKYRKYVVTGKGSSFLVRSNIIDFDPRNSGSSDSPSLWLDVYRNRWGIQLEWGYTKNDSFTDADSVNIFKRIGDATPKLLSRHSIWNNLTDDHTWDHSDSGLTFTYYFEVAGRNLVSPEISFTLDASFFAQLPTVHTVGPYEKFQRISDAIAAAADGDHIEVRPGTYKENVSFSGKNLTINGSWDYGKPPVIDGGGTIAITVPFVALPEDDWNRPRISGLSFTNCSVGIKSFSSIETESCLFTDVAVAVSMVIDSSSMIRHINANPFTPSVIKTHVNHCTFIAGQSGNIVASVTARGIAEQSGYAGEYSGRERFYITPAVSLSSAVDADLSNIVFYESKALQAYLPVSLQGNTSRSSFYRCNFWKTSTIARTENSLITANCTTVDPQFTDSTWWFLDETSPLAGLTYDTRVGYDVRTLNFDGNGTNANKPSPVEKVTATTVGLSAVLVTWSAAPADENIVRYRVYRVPGNPELFYINQFDVWDLKIPEDSLFSVIDSFSTENTALLDTTVEPGTPYLYVVAAVNDEDIEGEINLPAPPDISTYFVNKAVDRITLAASTWHMIGGIGTSDITLTENSPHVLFGWNDLNPPDKLYAQYYRSNSMHSTSGYWIKPSKDTILSVASTSLTALKAVESSVTINLEKGATGWNLIASPFPFTVMPSWTGTFIPWDWNADSIGYRKATVLAPWKAYWIHTDKDTVLTIWKKQTLSSYLESRLAKTSARSLRWRLQLTLQNGKSYDTDNYIGTIIPGVGKTTLRSCLEPPDAFNGAQLYLLDHENSRQVSDQSSEKLAELYKVTSSSDETYEWLVGIGASEQSSLLRIGSLSDLPEALYVFWVEKDRVINCREQNEITIPAQSTDRLGLIVITAHPEALALYTGKPALRAPFPNPCRSSATIEYTIPYIWPEKGMVAAGNTTPVTLALYDIQGRRIVSLVNNRHKPGVYRIVWQGTNGHGMPVAAGMYFMKLQCGNRSLQTRFCRIR